jgi:type II secretory pathway predicted ATPase ExeA
MHSPQHRSQGRPFLAAPRPAFYFPGRVVESARGDLERGIRRAEGVGIVVGQAGTGKSLLLAKLAEDLRDDFDVALLSGARICTRRALWQSVLAEIGEAYRGLEENDLRMSLVERVRGLAATCSGLVVLVDEAQTLPMRLVEELRLLSTVPTPMPAVHIVLAGTRELEERLANPKLESLAQRTVVRTYLEPFDHAETCQYVRSQCTQAGLAWEDHFDAGCDDKVFSITDGVPRLINQICDHALVAAGETVRLRPADIEAAWREIQRLPSPDSLAFAEPKAAETGSTLPPQDDSVISFGSLEGDDWADGWWDTVAARGGETTEIRADRPHRTVRVGATAEDALKSVVSTTPDVDPFQGPDVEFCFDASSDPFDELFDDRGAVGENRTQGPDEFRNCQQVAGIDGAGLAPDLADLRRAVEDEATEAGFANGDAAQCSPAKAWRSDRAADHESRPAAADDDEVPRSWAPLGERTWQEEYEYRPDSRQPDDQTDAPGHEAFETAGDDGSFDDDRSDVLDGDVIVVEEDLVEDPADTDQSVFAVRPADYRQLFARLRRR